MTAAFSVAAVLVIAGPTKDVFVLLDDRHRHTLTLRGTRLRLDTALWS